MKTINPSDLVSKDKADQHVFNLKGAIWRDEVLTVFRQKGWTVREAAKIAKIQPSRMSNILSAPVGVSLDMLHKIAYRFKHEHK